MLIAPDLLSVIAVDKSAPSNLTLAAVSMPTSKLDCVTGDKAVLERGSLVSDSLKVVALSS